MHQINIGVRPLTKGLYIAKSSVLPSSLDLTTDLMLHRANDMESSLPVNEHMGCRSTIISTEIRALYQCKALLSNFKRSR